MKSVADNAKQLERRFKGAANHWRIRILQTIERDPGLTLDIICMILDGNGKTISEHTRKLAHAGLIEKKYQGTSVQHSLSPHGKIFCTMIRKL